MADCSYADFAAGRCVPGQDSPTPTPAPTPEQTPTPPQQVPARLPASTDISSLPWPQLPPSEGGPSPNAPTNPSTSTEATDRQNGYRFVPGPIPGTVMMQTWDGMMTNPDGTIGGWKTGTTAYKTNTSGSGRGNPGITAAHDAISAYLQASSLAEARRTQAMSELQKVLPYAIPAGATDFPGFGPGSPSQAFAAGIGLKSYSPPTPTPITINPAAMAANPAPIDPTAQALISKLSSLG